MGARQKLKPVLKGIRDALKEAHDPERAVQEKRYLKSPFKFYGVNIPTLRSIANRVTREFKPADCATVFDLSDSLWRSEYHQEKTLAIFILAHHPACLDIKAMDKLEGMLSVSTGWDHTDYIATSLVSVVLESDPEAFEYLLRWSRDEVMWLRRASMISQIPLLRKGGGRPELFFEIARGLTGGKEFFIRKAMGWTVRELAKSDPARARDFLLEIKASASALTIREGAKGLPAIMKQEVLGEN